MQAHEVPTHVQAEDRVLLWFTFPQIVALTAVAALAYGAYSLAPFGPSGVRIALAVLIALAGVATVAGKIGGRRLPLVAADLLRFWLGPRRYAGAPSELVRSEPPAPPPSRPSPLRLMATRARRGLRKLRKNLTRRTGRRPFRAHCRFGKRFKRRKGERCEGHRADIRSDGQRGGLALLAASVAVATVFGVMALWTQPASADGHDQWFGEEFSIPPPIPGQRLFVEQLEVTGAVATLTLRAATALDIQVRGYGGDDGQTLTFQRRASLATGGRVSWDLPLNGELPSVTVSWQDELGEAGALSLEGAQLPHPLPSAAGGLCTLSVTSLVWTPGRIEGAVASTCASSVEERVELPVASGNHEASVTALIEGAVSDLSGTLTITSGTRSATATLVPNGSTPFTLPIGSGAAVPCGRHRGCSPGDHYIAAAGAGGAHAPPRAHRAPHGDGGGHHSRLRRHRQRDGDHPQRGRHLHRAHRLGQLLRPRVDRPPGRRLHRHPPGARARHRDAARAPRPRQERVSRPGPERRLRRPLRAIGSAGAGGGATALHPDRRHARRAAVAPRGPQRAVAMLRRGLTTLLLAGVALLSMGAAPEEEQVMLEAFNEVLTAMAYAAAGLAVFAVVWAGVVLMAEGAEARGGGKARSAVVMAVVGLVLVLSAKGVALALINGVIPTT